MRDHRSQPLIPTTVLAMVHGSLGESSEYRYGRTSRTRLWHFTLPAKELTNQEPADVVIS